jgi:hypothetical protein
MESWIVLAIASVFDGNPKISRKNECLPVGPAQSDFIFVLDGAIKCAQPSELGNPGFICGSPFERDHAFDHGGGLCLGLYVLYVPYALGVDHRRVQSG